MTDAIRRTLSEADAHTWKGRQTLDDEPLAFEELSSDPASPAPGYRLLYAKDAGGFFLRDADGNVYAVSEAGGRILQISAPLVIVPTKAGTFTDADADADGYLGIDLTDGRIYFRHSGGTWEYVAAVVDQAEINLSSAADAAGEAVRYDEFSTEHAAATGVHGALTIPSLTNTGPVDQQEETADLASPAAGYRRIFARDSGALKTKDSAGNAYALEFVGGKVLGIQTQPRVSSWQHKATATANKYGMRIEWGNDTLSAGTKAITFQQAFKTILEVFVQDKTGANAMYPSAIGTSGFTANGTGSDTFAWLAVGVD